MANRHKILYEHYKRAVLTPLDKIDDIPIREEMRKEYGEYFDALVKIVEGDDTLNKTFGVWPCVVDALKKTGFTARMTQVVEAHMETKTVAKVAKSVGKWQAVMAWWEHYSHAPLKREDAKVFSEEELHAVREEVPKKRATFAAGGGGGAAEMC